MPGLLLSVRFHDGRYHGSGEWPPSPARLFQALVAGAACGEKLPARAVESFQWLEGLSAPVIAAPSAYVVQSFKNFVPNNDLDAMGGDPARVNEIRIGKIIRPRTFDVTAPLLYAWTFEHNGDAERHSRTICEIADNLYQLGRGVDMAWAQGEVFEESKTDARLREQSGILWHPGKGRDGVTLACPHPGSVASLMERFKRTRERFKTIGKGKKASQLFSQAPKPSFGQIPYSSPSTFLLFDIRRAGAFAPHSFERIVSLAEKIRDQAAARLKRGIPDRAALIDRVFFGREAAEIDKAWRIRIVPLPSIGHAQTERSVRRVLVVVPPDCPIASGDVAWAFSGLALDFNSETGEVLDDGVALVPADDRTMLAHYGIEDAAPARSWRTVTPAALPERAARRRIDPLRMREEAKGGSERLREQAAAEWAVRQALRHAGIDTSMQAVRVQREPFEAKGKHAESFALGTRFAKERLWHIEIAFARRASGPLLVGDGRYLGLGLMAPARRIEGVFAFAIADGLTDGAEPLGLARALRRAVMARVQEKMGERTALPPFFTGHAADGAPARSGRHEHLAFVFDAPRKRLLIIAPHVVERREASKGERDNLRTLEDALDDFRELRAGPAGRLNLWYCQVEMRDDPLFTRVRRWKGLTPYRVTRHARVGRAAAALEADLLAECRRAGFPRPQIEVAKTFAKPGAGLFGSVTLAFPNAVAGPVLLGRDRHFGGGLFVPGG
jgi:CRISPR-associated protein Csb2